jgi:hypothetical protein
MSFGMSTYFATISLIRLLYSPIKLQNIMKETNEKNCSWRQLILITAIPFCVVWLTRNFPLQLDSLFHIPQNHDGVYIFKSIRLV